mgnify:CR=1 FL=1
MTVKYLTGDCREVLKKLPEKHFNTVVTSPPYYGLRDYGTEEQFGLEDTPEAFVKNLVKVFKEIKRVLRDDGTVWLNLGDSYSQNKNLIGIPYRVAFALQSDGWNLRQDIIWHKPNPMPESVTDRCTKAHEYIFLLSKFTQYYFDNESIKEDAVAKERIAGNKVPQKGTDQQYSETKQGLLKAQQKKYLKRNKRSVWTISKKPFKEAHFAVFPPKLIEPCVLAGCPENGYILDPFAGSGTTGLVAERCNRNATLIDLNKDYIQIAKKRISDDAPLLIGWANE